MSTEQSQEDNPAPETTPHGSVLRTLAAMFVAILIVSFAWITFFPGKVAPWWYNDSQAGWEAEHQVRPTGYDEVSQAIIDKIGLSHTAWDKTAFRAYSGNIDLRHDWVGDKLLVRYIKGESGIFDGSWQMHPPLTEDPLKTKKSLLNCLAQDDHGKLRTKTHKPTLVDMLQASGATVERAH